ncbi:hypothetical protein MMC28_003623 [Mycoblastus sanguinarius]|nr:hypothetical protein [Mycoblastus sanguinarius]
MSPPSVYACYAFNNGGCCLSQDQCLFAHLLTGPSSQYLQIRREFHRSETYQTRLTTCADRSLSPRDYQIAEAAGRAGFDCSNWSKLKGLIDALRTADTAATYPDRWTGPAAYQSDIYPDRWVVGNTTQPRGVMQSYRAAERHPSVPAFVISADQLIKNINALSRGQSTNELGRNATQISTISTDRQSNKRSGDVSMDLVSSSPKRVKTELPATLPAPAQKQGSFIDLTQDEPVYLPSSQQCTRPALASISNNARGKRPPRKRRPRRKPFSPFVQERIVERETTSMLARIASKIRASAHAIDMDRDTLRERWNVDSHLQLQHVTDHLGDLNKCFTRIEDGMRDSLEVIEGRLLGHTFT